MNSSPAVTLGQVAALRSGFMFKSSDWRTAGVPVIKIGNIKPGIVDLQGCSYVDDVVAEQASDFFVQPDDILVAMTGYVGEVARPGDIGKALLNQRVSRISSSSTDKLDENYLFYYLRLPAVKSELVSLAHGSAQPNLSNASILSLTIPLPRLSEQQAVAEVLGALDDKIAANTKLAATLTGLLDALFGQLGLNSDIRDEDEIIALDELVELNPRVAAPGEDEPVYVDMQKLPTAGMSINEWERRPAKGGARFMNDDTLLARITPCLENRKTGYVDFLPAGRAAIGSTEFIVMRSRPGIPKQLSYFLATSERFRTYAIRHMVGTSGRQRVSALDLAGYTVSKPDPESLAHFGEISTAQFKLLKSLTDENRTLVATRDALLPQLMSGKLRVKDAESVLENAGV